VASLRWLCDDRAMLRSLEINAALCELEKVHRDRLFWKPRIELSLDCFMCEQIARTNVLVAVTV
jgi:hypothetical protein